MKTYNFVTKEANAMTNAIRIEVMDKHSINMYVHKPTVINVYCLKWVVKRTVLTVHHVHLTEWLTKTITAKVKNNLLPLERWQHPKVTLNINNGVFESHMELFIKVLADCVRRNLLPQEVLILNNRSSPWPNTVFFESKGMLPFFVCV